MPGLTWPRVPGHEVVGVIEAQGELLHIGQSENMSALDSSEASAASVNRPGAVMRSTVGVLFTSRPGRRRVPCGCSDRRTARTGLGAR
jgi:hypothetical protein